MFTDIYYKPDSGHSLESAILIYQLENRAYYFQAHDIEVIEGQPHLKEGRPLDIESLSSLCKEVVPSLFNQHFSYIEDRLLASSGSVIGPDIWWIPSKIRPMFFIDGEKNGPVPWPGLIIAAYRRRLNIWAVKGDMRPTPETKLFVAPLLNMSGTKSSLCLGNTVLPARNSDFDAWENILFNSAFSNDYKAQRVRKGTLNALWKGLIKRNARKFPEKQLIPCKDCKTLGTLIEMLRGGEVKDD